MVVRTLVTPAELLEPALDLGELRGPSAPGSSRPARSPTTSNSLGSSRGMYSRCGRPEQRIARGDQGQRHEGDQPLVPERPARGPRRTSPRPRGRPGSTSSRPPRPCSTLRNRLQSIGVSVNETNRLTRMAKAIVRPKLLKNRPTCPSMKATGTKMTTSERLVAMHRQRDLGRADPRRLHRRAAVLLHVPEDVLVDDHRVVDHDADGQDQGRAS